MAQPWTVSDQARADSFEQQILGVASQLKGGHPDVIVVGFVQTTGSLMRQRLQEDPSRLPEYQRMLEMLAEYVRADGPMRRPSPRES
jgi:hypothetical protein